MKIFYRCKVDLCLAPFPNTGGTTVFASLWMGVPTLILEGNSYFTRGSASIMKSAGCSEFVVNTEDAYLQKACDMAKNKELLSKIKKEIPETLKQSSLCNPSIYANSLSQAIRQMWTSWCRNQTPKSFEL